MNIDQILEIIDEFLDFGTGVTELKHEHKCTYENVVKFIILYTYNNQNK